MANITGKTNLLETTIVGKLIIIKNRKLAKAKTKQNVIYVACMVMQQKIVRTKQDGPKKDSTPSRFDVAIVVGTLHHNFYNTSYFENRNRRQRNRPLRARRVRPPRSRSSSPQNLLPAPPNGPPDFVWRPPQPGRRP